MELMEYEFLYSILQKERFKTILKVCSDNKLSNEDWIRVYFINLIILLGL